MVKNAKSAAAAKTSVQRRPKTAAARKPVPDHREPSGAALLGQLLNNEGKVVPDRVAECFGMSKGQLGETIGVSPETLQRFSRAFAPSTQSRLKEMVEVVGRVTDWAGGINQAMAWYRAEPIPSFGGRTAEFLVKEGKAEAVRNYLDRVALGGFA
jgi:uncharacterized protein (DUF2384 family)